jgi:hypothetical protein
MNRKKNWKKNQKDAKIDAQHVTSTVNKTSTIESEEEFIHPIHVVFMDINSFLWVEEYGQLKLMNAFLFNAMIRD